MLGNNPDNKTQLTSQISSGPHLLKIIGVNPLIKGNVPVAYNDKICIVIRFVEEETGLIHEEMFWTNGGGSSALRKILKTLNTKTNQIIVSDIINKEIWAYIKSKIFKKENQIVNYIEDVSDKSQKPKTWAPINEEYLGEPELDDEFPEFSSNY